MSLNRILRFFPDGAASAGAAADGGARAGGGALAAGRVVEVRCSSTLGSAGAASKPPAALACRSSWFVWLVLPRWHATHSGA